MFIEWFYSIFTFTLSALPTELQVVEVLIRGSEKKNALAFYFKRQGVLMRTIKRFTYERSLSNGL